MDRNELKGKQTPGKITSGQRVEWSEESGGTISLNAPDWSGFAHIYQHFLKKKYKKEGEANRTGMWPEDMVERIKELENTLEKLIFGKSDLLITIKIAYSVLMDATPDSSDQYKADARKKCREVYKKYSGEEI